MRLKSSFVLLLQRLMDPLGLRLINTSRNKVRGVDPLFDLQSLVGKDEEAVIFDVGANDGETVRSFLTAFPRGRVVAFEPAQQCYTALKEMFTREPRVAVHNVALGSSRGTSQLNLYAGSNMNSLLEIERRPVEAVKSTFDKLGAKVGTAEVQVETIDGFCAQNGVAQVDVLKVDTQGFDMQVLNGAEERLRKHQIKTLLLEVNFVPMYRGQGDFVEMHQFLTSLGYRLVDFYNHSRHDGCTVWCDACYCAVNAEAFGASA